MSDRAQQSEISTSGITAIQWKASQPVRKMKIKETIMERERILILGLLLVSEPSLDSFKTSQCSFRLLSHSSKAIAVSAMPQSLQ